MNGEFKINIEGVEITLHFDMNELDIFNEIVSKLNKEFSTGGDINDSNS